MEFIPAGVNIDPGLTPTSPGLSAPRGGEEIRSAAVTPLSAWAERPGEVGARKRLSNRWYYSAGTGRACRRMKPRSSNGGTTVSIISR